MKTKFIVLFQSVALFFALTANAGSLESKILKQADARIKNITEQAGLILNFKGLNPAKPLGITGITVGLEGTAGLINDITTPDNSKTDLKDRIIPLARFHIAKGLPFGFDLELSGMHSKVLEGLGLIEPETIRVSIVGGGLKYALLNEDKEDPISLAIRGTYTRGKLEKAVLDMIGGDLTISKEIGIPFLHITPYIGGGLLYSRFTLPTSTFDSELKPEATSYRLVGGLAMSLFAAKLVTEVNYSPTTETTTASALLSFAL